MKPNPLTIDSALALASLQGETRRGGPRRFTALAVRAPGATETVNAQWQRRIESDYFACGCGIGTAVSLVAVASCIVAFTARTGGWSAFAWTDGLLLLAIFVASTGLGKLVGIRLARRRLRKALAELASLYPPLPAVPASQRRTRQCSVHG